MHCESPIIELRKQDRGRKLKDKINLLKLKI